MNDMEQKYRDGGGLRCPACDSPDIEGHTMQVDCNTSWQPMTCNSCFAYWDDVYTFIGIENFQKGTEDE